MNGPQRTLVTPEDVERRLVLEHKKPYFDWLRHVVTLALAALTTLVALQGHYVPSHPKFSWLLAVGWVSLAVVIACGLFALRSEYSTPLAAAAKLRALRASGGEEAAVAYLRQSNGTLPHPLHKWSVRGMVAAFIIALCSVCAFAIVNLPQ
jgi:hypothetical protein